MNKFGKPEAKALIDELRCLVERVEEQSLGQLLADAADTIEDGQQYYHKVESATI